MMSYDSITLNDKLPSTKYKLVRLVGNLIYAYSSFLEFLCSQQKKREVSEF